MKLNLITLTSLVALAAAQSSSTTESAPSTTVSLSPEQSCAKKCDASDLCCIAGCFKVPCPNGSQANDTNNCVAACPQGTGSPADTQRYANCQNECYSSHFFPITATGAPGASKTSASDSDATTTGKDSSSTGKGSSSTGSGSKSSQSGSSGTSTSSGSAASGTPNAASVAQLKLGVSAAGIAGLALGIWAL
ncbi:hypothetical protein ETB97_003648 [Aspergillus alliaceus]|uniref:Extracellular membrane protein CFEM domain-containing protein n=1 Tax=Petromyces alliaceus TaxID=209559 RepID=A0A5N7C0Z5_PETAA|nr:uncharacterized protein BDW43DRAFT_310913 [Aspergillus alliaceus]KAB8233550.1 hypothetical protein BDW43DRAFT_310913 [Aspergillus alliaceus]KAE8387689.1 hypothetical protein BDV23DRAFT_160621 [Aspergillus alliaceus]KAF5858851.1 hypothetical protein ETB97_003648 [Aspergillus burnettii]